MAFIGKEVPPKTLNEAGQMAVCYSAAWESKVVTSAYWVESSQVSKTAPTGEYLTTGSFMIRGKKNYLPPSHLILGFGILFKLGDESLEAHKNERKVRTLESELSQELNIIEEEKEVEIFASDEEDEKKSDEMQKSSEESTEQMQVEEKVEVAPNDAQLDSEDSINNVDLVEESEDKKEGNEQKTRETSEVDNETTEFPDTTLAMNFSSQGMSFKATVKSENEIENDTARPSFSR